MKNISKTNKAFTLAEVLITLTIIGVVAAMTIPNLLTNNQEKEHQVAAQKAFSTFANAMTMRTAISGEDYEDFLETTNITQADAQLIGFLTCNPTSATAINDQQLWNDDHTASGGNIQNVNCVREGAVIPVIECQAGDMCKFKDGMTAQFNAGGGVVVTVDTNGERGPSRQVGRTFDGTPCNGRSLDGISVFDTGDDTPDVNNCPDLVAFRLNVRDNTIEPANKRTRNILATGNARNER